MQVGIFLCVKTSRQRAVWKFSENLSVLVVSPISQEKFFGRKMTGETHAPSLIAKVLIFSIFFGTIPYVEEANPLRNNKVTDFPGPISHYFFSKTSTNDWVSSVTRRANGKFWVLFPFLKNCQFKIKTTLEDCDQRVANAF